MPHKKGYTMKTIGKAPSKTPVSVMGSQGKPANIPVSFNKPMPTKMSRFPESTRKSKPARKY